MAKRLLYFARGRGRGHALAGLAIAEQLSIIRPDAEICFVSYGTGAETLREHGHAVYDLDLPDDPNVFAVGTRLPKALDAIPSSLIAAHEEFDAALQARHRGVPCVILTDWFLTDPEDWRMLLLQHASEIVFLDDESVVAEAIFTAPDSVAEKVYYVGPLLRPLRYRHSDRLRARREAGLPVEALIVSVFIHPGRRSESVAPLAGLLGEAFELIDAPAGSLVLWDRDAGPDFDCIMAASDLVITKGNRNIVQELAAMGVPSISVSHGLNWIDDIRTAGLANNRTVCYADLDAASLARLICERIARGFQPVPFANGARGAAERLAYWLL